MAVEYRSRDELSNCEIQPYDVVQQGAYPMHESNELHSVFQQGRDEE